MIKKLLTGVTTACVLSLGMLGCDLNPVSDDDEVSIELTGISSITAGSGQAITAKVKGNVAITSIDVEIFDTTGDNLTDISFEVQKSNLSGDEKEVKVGDDMSITVTPDEQACNGRYILKMTAVAGSASTTKSDTFTVTGGEDCSEPVEDPLTEKEVTLGNQDASAGSALDVDAMTVYKTSECVESVRGDIDAWFGIVGGNATMMSPASATQFAPKNWTVKNDTKFLKVEKNFDDIEFQSEIDALWTGTGSGSVSIAAGDVVVIKTVDGDYRLLKVESASNATTGSVTVTGKIK